MIDLSKLTPAPWEFVSDATGCGVLHKDVTHKDDLWIGDLCRPEAEFIALARNAFDVMMRRRWYAVWHDMEGKWYVRGCDGFFLSRDCAARFGIDPFTALVEADAWYKANVENT